MLSHERIWSALDALAERHGLTASGLARRAGLDPTAFNKSKRRGADGRDRWPSTESLAKVLDATGSSLDDFMRPCRRRSAQRCKCHSRRRVSTAGRIDPPFGFCPGRIGRFFDDGGFPAGQGWDVVDFPAQPSERPGVYALEVQGDSMLPLYRDGDILIVEPGAQVRRGDRVVVRSREGEVMAKVLSRQSPRSVELISLNPDHPNRSFELSEIDWMARIIWASQ
jgi:phage repressor protein C with HTH and peptisase S24 domain